MPKAGDNPTGHPHPPSALGRASADTGGTRDVRFVSPSAVQEETSYPEAQVLKLRRFEHTSPKRKNASGLEELRTDYEIDI